MDLTKIQDYFQRKIGLKPNVIKDPIWHHLIKERMEKVSLKSPTDYVEFLVNDTEEEQAFINHITIGDTWFYRDIEAFKLLAKSAASLKQGKNPLSVLSIGCSSGEEPYSVLFSLLEAGLEKEDIHIDAVDISQEKINQFEKGVYGARSFRSTYLLFRENYFQELNNQWQILPHLKKLIDAKCKNILTDSSLEMTYDVIFCRHLMVYFDTAAREKLLETIHQKLKPTGLLFVGHVEMDLFSPLGYQIMPHPLSYAYKKEGHFHGTHR